MYLFNSLQKNQFKIFYWLLYRELLELKKSIFSSLFDSILWPLKILILYGYILPGLGLASNYGALILSSTIVLISFAGIFDSCNLMLIESEKNSKLSFELTLPINSGLIYLSKIIAFSFRTAIISSCVYPIGIIFLGDLFDFSNFSILKFILIFILINIMFAAFALFLSSLIKTKNVYLSHTGWLLWFILDFGCTNYSWQVLKITIPFLAYISLFNPITYASEASRVAAFGQDFYLDFWFSILVLIITIILFAVYSIKFMKNKLDSF